MAQGTHSAQAYHIRHKFPRCKFLIKSSASTAGDHPEHCQRNREPPARLFDEGVAALKPLTMVQVAQVVGVHETTVSRAISNSDMQTP